MKLMKIRVITALLLTGCVFPAWAKDSEIQKHTQAFLDAYVGGDRQVILTLIDQENIRMYGSDAAEIVHGSGALLKLVAADQQLWGGSAHFGAMEHVSLVQNHSLAPIFFDIPFSVGGRQYPFESRQSGNEKENAGFSYRVQMRSLPKISVQLSCFSIRDKRRRSSRHVNACSDRVCLNSNWSTTLFAARRPRCAGESQKEFLCE